MSVRYDFSDAEVINSLPIRHAPHWHILQFCRHLGVIRRELRPWLGRTVSHEDGWLPSDLFRSAGSDRRSRSQPCRCASGS